MTAIQTALLQIKQYFLDLGLVLGISIVTNFWNAISAEFNIVLVAHIIVLLLVSLLVRQLGRWIGEEIDQLSDIEFMHRFPCERHVFEKLKIIETHGLLYTPNYDYIPYDTNKIKIYSNFFGLHTTETFEMLVKYNSVTLQNIHGSYASSVTYEYDGTAIVGQWMVKPKGFRRLFAIIFIKVAAKQIKKDFQRFVDKSKGE